MHSINSVHKWPLSCNARTCINILVSHKKCYTCNVVLGVAATIMVSINNLILSHCESFLLLRLDHTGIGIAVDKLERNIAISNIQDQFGCLTKNDTRSCFVTALHSLVEINLVGNVT